MLTYQIYNETGRYLCNLFPNKDVHSTIDHDIIVKNVITEDNKELAEKNKIKLNLFLSEVENDYDFKEKNILEWKLRGNDLIIKKRVTLKDARIMIRIIRMPWNEEKISYFVMSKLDHMCKEFSSMEEAEEFIKKYKDSAIN
jgi:hypothetical protein